VAYVLRDCGARALFATASTLAVAAAASSAIDRCMVRIVADGADFLYSSGTTGRPKGIRRALEQLASVDMQRGDLAWKRFDAKAALAAIECPRTVDLASELPRTEAGKLMKRLLRDRYEG
jgi:acyl-coenzyme A synthetase/AMP-(fatty) acid ligase